MKLYAYNPAWATHEAMHAAAARWHRRGLVSSEQEHAIRAAYPLDFYRPGLFLRIGLFVFTLIGAFGALGFVTLLLQFEHFRVLALVGALGGFAALELFIRGSRLYRAGVDEALLYFALGWTMVLLADVMDDFVPLLLRYQSTLSNGYTVRLLGLMLPVLLAATVRYADRLVAAASYLMLLAFVASVLLLKFPTVRFGLPFLLMAVSGGAYWLVQKLRRRPDLLHYRACLTTLKALTLVTFYLSGNYYVVREGNALLGGLYQSPQIPLAPVFYLLTAIVPVAYVAVGLRRPDRIWLLVGLAAAAFSLFTLRYYRSLLPPELAAVLAGAVLTAVAAVAARYLRPARHGLTSLPSDEQPPHFNLESLVVAQTAHAPVAPAAGFEFGGGSSGGGGAEGSY